MAIGVHTFAFYFSCFNFQRFKPVLKKKREVTWGMDLSCVFFQWIFQVPVKGGRDYITP